MTTMKEAKRLLSIGDELCLAASWARETDGGEDLAAVIERALPVVDSHSHLLAACQAAAEICDGYGDGAPDSPEFARDCNRVGGILDDAIQMAKNE